MKNKTICFFTTPAYGHMISVGPVIKKLVQKGYTVKCYSTNKFKNIINIWGADFIPYKIDIEKYMLNELTSDFLKLTIGLTHLNQEAYLAYINEFDNMIKPDLIIYDSMCSFAKNISIKKNIKNICFTTTLAFNLPVFIFSRMFLSSISLFIKNSKEFINIFNKEKVFRKTNKLPNLKIIDLFLNKGNKTIVFTPKEFQPFVKTFDKSFYFVGTTIKDRIEIDYFKQEKYDNYDIYISLGTITNNTSLLNDIIENKTIKEHKVIISTGQTIINKINKINKNIIFKEKVNQIKLLPNIKYFINHGGLNSVFESIYYSIPQICIPQQEEQKFVSKIVQKKKLGISLSKYNDKKLNIFFKKCYNKKQLAKMSKIIKSYDGTENTIKIIENFINI